MRKIAVIGLVLLTASAFGCSKKSQQGAEEQAAPAPSAQEAAPAPKDMGTMDHNQAAPGSAPGNDQGMAGMSHDNNAPATPATPATPPASGGDATSNGNKAQ